MFGACKVASKNADISTKTNGDQVSASIIRQWHIPAIVGSDNKQSMSRRCCHDAIRQQRQAVRPSLVDIRVDTRYDLPIANFATLFIAGHQTACEERWRH